MANVYDVQKVLKLDFVQCLGALPSEDLFALEDGMRLVLDL